MYILENSEQLKDGPKVFGVETIHLDGDPLHKIESKIFCSKDVPITEFTEETLILNNI